MSKFVCASSAFAKALGQVTAVVPGNPLVPALSNVLLVGTGSVVGQAASLRLICSNLEVTLGNMLAIDCQENFAALVPAKKLLETLRSLPDQPLTFTVDEEARTLTVKAERSKYVLSGDKPADFPRPPALNRQHRSLTLPANQLRAGLQSALTTARRDNLGVEFENVLLEVEERLINGYEVNVVGADNPNVSVFTYSSDKEMEAEQSFSFMLGRAPAEHLLRLLSEKDEAEVTLLADTVNVRLRDGRWASRLAEGTYPDYRRVMRAESANTLLVNAPELLAAVRRLDKYAPGADRSITMQLSPGAQVSVSTVNYDVSQSGDETVSGEYSGEEMAVSFNAEQLANLLALYKGQVELGFGDETRAVMLTEAVAAHDYSPLTCLLVPLHTPVAA